MTHAEVGVLIPQPLLNQLFSREDIARLESKATVRWHRGDRAPSIEEAVDLLQGCKVAVGSWGTPSPDSEGLLRACPELRLWEHVAGSVKRFFNEALVVERPLTVATCKRAIGDSVAELIVGELIVALRRVFENAAANRLGPTGKPPGIKILAGSRVGIVGASVVGRELARLLVMMKAKVRVFDPFLSEQEAADLKVEKAPNLLEMMSDLDALSINTPLLPQTTRQVHGEHFRALPDDAIVINAARGACIHEEELIEELKKGRLLAILDVSDPEPAKVDSPLRHLENVILTSHIAGPATQLMGTLAVDDITAFLEGGQPKDVVTADLLEKIA